MKKTLSFSAIILFGLQTCFSQSNFCFTPASYSPLQNNFIQSMCYADFNSDGYKDIAAVNAYHNIVNLFISNGSNGFQPVVTHTYISYFSAFPLIVTADFNNDAKPDLAITDNVTNQIGVLLGTGGGNFSTMSSFSVGVEPSGMVVDDFNSDGKADLAVSNFSSNTVSVLSGNGSGSFSLTATYTVGIQPQALVCGDFNNDGKKDLITSNGSALSVLKGNTNGTFHLNNTVNIGFDGIAGLIPFMTFDVNNDNKQDLVGLKSGSVSVVRGNGNFTFAAANNYSLAAQIYALAHGDFNSDGKQDILAASIETTATMYTNYSILPSTGSGFGSAITNTVINTGYMNWPYTIFVLDINNDNRDDFIISMYNTQELPVYLNCNTVDVGIKTLKDHEPELVLSPNPANNVLQIQVASENNDLKTYIIYNNQGKKTDEQDLIFENGVAKIITEDLVNGFYVLQLRTAHSEFLSKPFIISK